MTDEPEIDDDHFATAFYEGGLRRSISGFGAEAIELIDNSDLPDYEAGVLTYHINELVRWCRHLNGELKRAQR